MKPPKPSTLNLTDAPAGGNRLVWSDEFDGALDTNVWTRIVEIDIVERLNRDLPSFIRPRYQVQTT